MTHKLEYGRGRILLGGNAKLYCYTLMVIRHKLETLDNDILLRKLKNMFVGNSKYDFRPRGTAKSEIRAQRAASKPTQILLTKLVV